MTLPGGRESSFAYDAKGQLTSLTPPGRPATTFGYTDDGLLAARTAPGGVTTSYDYGADRQLARIERPGGSVVGFAYDAAGRVSSITLARGNVTFAYASSTGNLQQLGAPEAGLTYTYDGSLPTGTTLSGTVAGTVQRTSDDDFRGTSSLVNGEPVAYQYDDDGLITGAGALSLDWNAQNALLAGTTLGDVTTSLAYDSFGELTGQSAAYIGTPIFATGHEFDKLGRITQKVETIGGSSDTYQYAYDSAGRLAEVRKNGPVTATYAYDANGNRVGGTYDDQDRLTAFAGTTYAYTPSGELQSKTDGTGTTTYDYDELGNLVAAGLPGGTSISYVVDGRNRRVGKKVDGALVQGFLYDNRSILAELDGSNQVVSRFVYASRPNVPDYMIRGGTTYRIVSDHLGSPRLVVDAGTGAIAQRMDFDEWGNVLADTNPGFQPFGFAGGLYDRHTKLTRFGARDYDPEVGRWTAKDPAGFRGGDTNLYAYVANDPVNAIDPTGLVAWCTSSSNYAKGYGAGAEVCFSDEGIVVCAEVGFGFGTGGGSAFDSGLKADLPRSGEEVFAEASGQCGPVQGTAGLALDDCGDLKLPFGVQAGPLKAGGEYDWHSGELTLANSAGLTADLGAASEPDAGAAAKGKGGCKLGAKVGAKV